MQSSTLEELPAETVVSVAPFQIRARSFTAVVLRITGRPDEAFEAAVEEMMRTAPRFYLNAPIVLDVAEAEDLESKADFLRIMRVLRLRKLLATGVQNASEAQSTGAFQAGLVTLRGGRESGLPPDSREATGDASAETEPAPNGGTLLITEPVRSGQRVFAEHGDLVVVAPVSAGAEIIAGGNIHVYGALRGRALAGVHGNAGARIFCQQLEADLVAIAGLYRTSEDLEEVPFKQNVQVFLENDALRVEALK